MKNSIISGLRQGLGPRFLLGVMAIVTVLVLSSVEPLIKLYREFSILANGYHIQFFMTALSSDTFTPFVTIVAVLPFAGNYVDEVKSKFSRFAMLRTSYSSYLFSRIFICFLLGGMVILLGVLVTYFLCTLLFLPMESATVEEANELPKLIGQCFLLFLSGGFWAVLGMTLSTMMESKYIAYASPFVIYYLLVMLYERYFPKAYLIYPREWMNPSDCWPLGIWSVAVTILELTALLGLVFYCRGKRRLQQL